MSPMPRVEVSLEPPRDVLFAQASLELGGRLQNRLASYLNSGVLERFRRMLLPPSAAEMIDRKTPSVRQLFYRSMQDPWGPIAEPIAERNGTRIDPPRRLNAAQTDDAMQMMMQLATGGYVSSDVRSVFLSNSRDWVMAFPKLHAKWSERRQAVVFFSIALGWQFLPWANAKLEEHEDQMAQLRAGNPTMLQIARRASMIERQLDLINALRQYESDIIVVAPAIVAWTEELGDILITERGKIWTF